MDSEEYKSIDSVVEDKQFSLVGGKHFVPKEVLEVVEASSMLHFDMPLCDYMYILYQYHNIWMVDWYNPSACARKTLQKKCLAK
jgi:hypothetical protein